MRLSYKGTNFFGWQIQPDQITIQEEIETALTKLNHGIKIAVTGCGRTDTGVHASEYYAHFDMSIEHELTDFLYKLNCMISTDVSIQEVIPVSSESHARFDAIKRTYHYFIHTDKDPFINDISWYNKQELDIKKMNEACVLLIKHEDFECFSKVKTEVNNFNCNITNAAWVPSEKGYIFTITANRFLRNMVRAIVGTMLEIGLGKISLEEFQNILDSKNRSEAGQSVPAKGLFLAKIEYPNL
jgi:tRNA pseudouridine38-40 synthase